jgi:hypothetical protein
LFFNAKASTKILSIPQVIFKFLFFNTKEMTTFKSTPAKFCRLDSTRLLLSNLILEIMEAIVSKSWTLEQYKNANSINAIDVFTSKKTGRKYGCNHNTGEFIGMLSEDFDKTQPIRVLRMVNEESGETWDFICNGEPRMAEETL